MAEMNLGGSTVKVATPIPVGEKTNERPEDLAPVDVPEQNMQVTEAGMSMEELNDANKIKVTIADYKTPLVVFFGPPACGKTMTLIRLTRYLQGKGYTIEPVTSFRPTYDKNYSDMCANFDSMIGSEDAAPSTSKINFMLVQVLHDGKTL